MKSGDNPDLLDLAARVADGAAVDWSALDALASADERELIGGLRLLERVADVHSSAGQRSTDASSRATREAAPPDDPRQWGPLLIVERLGAGTFGTVYRAWDPKLERHVALKLLANRNRPASPTDTLPDDEVIDEGRLMARIRHPGVITVYGADRFDGRVGLWMELVEGRTLEAEVKERGPLPALDIARLAVDVADALAAVHRAGLIHRDVKAQNIVRDSTGRVVLMDFGAGIDRGDATDAGALAGTPLYLAPEVIDGAAATTASDVYSLGVLLHYLATGAFPVRGRTLTEIRRAHARGDRQPIATARPDLPRSLARAIDRASAAAPADRFGDAAAMAAALHDIEAQKRRRRTALGGAVAIAMVATAIALGWIAGSGRHPPSSGTGLVQEQIDPALVQRAAILGPSFDSRIPCVDRSTEGIALCQLHSGAIESIRPGDAEGSMVTRPSPRALLSPDGSRLAYVWTVLSGGQPSMDVLHVFDRRSRGDRALHRETVIELTRWTGDGSAIVARTGRDDTGQYVRIPLDGSAPAPILQLTKQDDRHGDLSPDGRIILIARETAAGDRDLIAMDAVTGEERWRRAGPADEAEPRWLPDGRGVVFVTDATGCESLAVLHVDADRPAASPAILDEMGRTRTELYGFGPDGTLLMAQRPYRDSTQIAAIDVAAGRISGIGLLRTSRCDSLLGADWSPDGSRLAHVESRPTPGARARLVIERRDGQDRREIALAHRFVEFAQTRWSPDGARVAVLYRTGVPLGAPPVEALIVAGLSGDGRITTVIEEATSETPRGDPAWDPAGRRLYFRQDDAIVRVDLDRAVPTVERIYRAPAGAALRAFDVSRAGTFAVAHPATDRTGGARAAPGCLIRVVDRDGRQSYSRLLGGGCNALTWRRNGSQLLVATARGAVAALQVIDPGADAVVPVSAETPLPNIWHLSWHPDDVQLLVSAGRASEPARLIQVRNLERLRLQ